MHQLEYLYLNNLPYITWTMPPCFATNLTSLTALIASASGLTGALPQAWHLPNLGQLILSDNQITGALPSTWSTPNLVGVLLSNNKELSGTLPTALLELPSLSTCAVEGTRLGGHLPAALCRAASLRPSPPALQPPRPTRHTPAQAFTT